MIISVINKKGGVGKTPISFSIAKDLDYFLISNDDSVIENVYPNMAKIVEDDSLKLIENCVYDFGGFIAPGVLKVLQKSDVVIVPCFADIDALKRTIKTIQEMQNVKKIMVIVTKTERVEDFNYVNDAIKKYFPNIDVLELKKSRIFNSVMESGQSVLELANESALTRYSYRHVIEQYKKILQKLHGAKR